MLFLLLPIFHLTLVEPQAAKQAGPEEGWVFSTLIMFLIPQAFGARPIELMRLDEVYIECGRSHAVHCLTSGVVRPLRNLL